MRLGRTAVLIGGLACSLALGGCAAWRTGSPAEPAATSASMATGPRTSAEAQNPSRVATVQAGNRQQFSGRLSLRVHQPRTGATDGGTLLFEFEGNPDEGSLVLQTVIGTAVATARWNPQGAEILMPQGKRTGATLDDVATALLGQELPLAAILHWVRAIPWARAPHEPRTDGFDQLGWSISLEGWHERVITARRSARPERTNDLDITVRARLDEPSSIDSRPTP